MRIPRIYQNVVLQSKLSLKLDEEASRHLLTVLRLAINDCLYLFNGNGNKYLARITEIKKNGLYVYIDSEILEDHESPTKIHLGQAISKGERMDWVIQKTTELGIHSITPLFSERCVVHLKNDRIDKRQIHWQRIANSACEQSERNTIPIIKKPLDFLEWVLQISSNPKLLKFILMPETKNTLSQIDVSLFTQTNAPLEIALVIGPEGGLSDVENEYAKNKGFIPISLGPRILRTETAAIAAIAILQYQFGDMNT